MGSGAKSVKPFDKTLTHKYGGETSKIEPQTILLYLLSPKGPITKEDRIIKLNSSRRMGTVGTYYDSGTSFRLKD